ncbi:MAG: hypothetical protein QXI32_00950 [Candidatus Bathyarchaeia archaeon]
MFIFWIMLVAAVVQSLAAAYWFIYPSRLSSFIVQVACYFAEIELQFFSVFSELSSLLILVLLFSPAVLLFYSGRKGIQPTASPPKDVPQFLKDPIGPVLLIAGFGLSLIAAAYPLFPSLNPGQEPYSVDFKYYKAVLDRLAAQGFSANLCPPDRVLSYAFIYTFHKLLGTSVSATLMYLPLILGPLFVVLTYLLGRELLRDLKLAGLASLFAATSYTVTVGMFAGYYANWLANCFATFFLYSFVRWNNTHSVYVGLLMILSSFMILLSHMYTWILLMAAVVFYFIIDIRKYVRSRSFLKVSIILLFLLAIPAADLIRISLLKAVSSYDASIGLLRSLRTTNFLELNKNLMNTFHRFSAGFLANSPVLLLSIIGYSLHKRSDDFHRLLSCMLIISIPLILFGNTASIQSRVLYVLPFPVMCALGLMNVGLIFANSFDQQSFRKTYTSTVLVVCLSQLNYLLRSMATLVGFAG